MNVVVVESPAKAKTINKYLGKDFTVLASYGHIRDLTAKDGSVRPDDAFAMDWQVDPKAKKHIQSIVQALKTADRLFLATDPDREGEAISWHVLDVLAEAKALNGIEVKRVVFNEITKSAIVEAFKHPRDLDDELVNAYLARRALDYLVGFTLSPVLWRKLPGSRSAGRVQSVALRLVCDRESEIEAFRAQEYWTIKGAFATEQKAEFTAQLTHLEGRKLAKFDLGDAEAAADAVRRIESRTFSVGSVERKKVRRHPSPPFTTSTLQQEASRKLYFAARKTMQVAQRLYEGVAIGGETVGLITYMRTDGVQMANEAIHACRALVGQKFGDAFVPDKPRIYKTRAKNAQEAHEAIRPTDVTRTPESVAGHLDADQRKLYELIWKRTIASQMESAILDQVAVDVTSEDSDVVLRATGSVVAFEGFLKLYEESRDDAEDDESQRRLPDLKEGTGLAVRSVLPEQHFTQPPPRYSEASLVRKLEELGIGRPSTYATILSVLQDRDYVRLEKRRFIPEDRGRLVTAFLEKFFERYVEYSFTAEMEEKLDEVSDGRVDWKQVLDDFWREFNTAVDGTKELRVSEVVAALDDMLGHHFFREREDGSDPRSCPTCDDGKLSLKLGKFGAFVGCSNYPECRYTRPLVADTGGDGNGDSVAENGTRTLGQDSETGKDVTLRRGPYGYYVQLGEADEDAKTKPKRVSLPRDLNPDAVDLSRALKLLSLPREIGLHEGQMILAGLGRFGPYLQYNGVFYSLRRGDDVLEIGHNRAVEIISTSPKKPPKVLGKKDGKPVTLRANRWGPFVALGRTYASVPKSIDPESLTLEAALSLIAAKGKGGKDSKPAKEPKAPKEKAAEAKKAPAKKAAAKKTAAKKGVAKKAAPKKTAVKKASSTPTTGE